MNKKLLFILILNSLFVTATATNGFTEQDIKPGLITPDNPLWIIENNFENYGVRNGFRNRSKIIQERASEAYRMQERNKTISAERAVNQLNKLSENLSENDSIHVLEKAEKILEKIRERQNERKGKVNGLDNALDQIRTKTRERKRSSNPIVVF